MDKKYQIFVSSTYEDLRKEREAVSKAILELGDIPVGMEMFSAADEQQWKLIKRQIEQSDYYVVIVAHRYGSMAGDVSFTEKEYDYADKIGVPVLGFVIDSSAEWPANRVDVEPGARSRLESFKSKIKSRMVSFWVNADSLNGKVLAALSKQKNLNPRPGWIRADQVPGPEVLADIAKLGSEVARLNEENAKLRTEASLEAKFPIVDTLLDIPERQALILMRECGIDLPLGIEYMYAFRTGSAGNGYFGSSNHEKVVNAGLVRVGGSGQFWILTEYGARFADWSVSKGRKSDFLWTPVGGWGQLEPGSHHEKWLNDFRSKRGHLLDESTSSEMQL